MAKARTGTLTKTRDGRFQAKITLVDGSRVCLPPLAKGTTEARAKEYALAKALQAISERWVSVPPDDSIPGVKQSADNWIKAWHQERLRRALKTAEKSLEHWRLYIQPFLGKHPKTWTPDDFRALSVDLDSKIKAKIISWKYATNIWGTATKMAADCFGSKDSAVRVREDNNPALGVRGPDKGESLAKQWLYPDEFLAFINHPEISNFWKRLVTLAIYIYCRGSELTALEWDDIDFTRKVIHITKQLDRDSGATTATKSKAPRTVPIEPELMPVLLALKAEASGKLVCDFLHKHSSRDFKVALGKAVTRKALFNKSPSSKPIRFHDLRATGITWTVLRADPPLQIQWRAGHENLKTTQEYIREADPYKGSIANVFPAVPLAMLGLEQSSAIVCTNQVTST